MAERRCVSVNELPRDDLCGRGAELIDVVRDRHAQQASRLMKPLQMISHLEHDRTASCRIRAHAFEDAAAVVEALRTDVHRGVLRRHGAPFIEIVFSSFTSKSSDLR
jgi:hypothetical protein